MDGDRGTDRWTECSSGDKCCCQSARKPWLGLGLGFWLCCGLGLGSHPARVVFDINFLAAEQSPLLCLLILSPKIIGLVFRWGWSWGWHAVGMELCWL